METMLKAIEVGMTFVKDFPAASRFDVCNYLHGYNPRLGFKQLTEISREISCRLNKGVNW